MARIQKPVVLSLVLFWAPAALALDRAGEDSMFGAPVSTGTAPAPAVEGASAAKSPPKELEIRPWRDAFATGEVNDNALQIGGIYYQRWITSTQQGVSAANSPVVMPLQFDAFMDARPSDRVRGYVQGRLLYDPTRDEFSNTSDRNGQGSLQYNSTSGAPQTLTGGTTSQTTNNPKAVLDQAWIKFDVERTVFVTAGKQHVKWGTSRFWNPTDFLSTQRRDPLLPYDLRLGNTMVKLGMPLHADGRNLYGVALFDNPAPGSTLGGTGGAFRAETLIGPAEAGLEIVSRGHTAPAYGADLSSGLGPFDVYAEAALFTKAPATRYQMNAPVTPGAEVATLVSARSPDGPFTQASGGANYSFGWRDNRQATFGAEYFYNELGYDDRAVYPLLILLGGYQPFYTGRHYGAVYLTAEGPDAAKHTSYTFSTLSNLSDHSYISRIDFAWRFLSYLTFELYADRHFGRAGGEFNFEVHTPALTAGGVPIPAVDVPATRFDVGMGLRMSF